MLEGRFGNTSGAPYLEARISMPRLSLRGFASFLVDTGADGTVFMPADSKKLGVNFGALRNPVTSEGIGGAAKGFTEQVVLSFSDRRFIYSYLLDIEIAAPTAAVTRSFLHPENGIFAKRSNCVCICPVAFPSGVPVVA
jgi:hypothetical protein